MDIKKQHNERRRHKRYAISGGGFALLKWNGSELLGTIRDISYGGIRLSHIDDNENLQTLAKVNIKLFSGKTCHDDFSGRCIWNRKEKNGFATTRVNMKQCGIAFGELDSSLQKQISEFIVSLASR